MLTVSILKPPLSSEMPLNVTLPTGKGLSSPATATVAPSITISESSPDTLLQPSVMLCAASSDFSLSATAVASCANAAFNGVVNRNVDSASLLNAER